MFSQYKVHFKEYINLMNSLPKYNMNFKNLSLLFAYIAIALLAISDSGIQLLILMEIGPGSRTLRLIAMWLLLFKILMTRYTKKEFFILTPIAILALYNYYLSGNIFCVYMILLIAASKNIDYLVLFKTLFYSTLFTIIFVCILSFFEIGGPTQLTQDFGRGMIETRYCFGLFHPNIWHQAIARCIAFGCIGYYQKLSIVHLSILFVFNYFIYMLSVSRTGLLVIWFFLILIILYKYLPKFMHTLFVKIGSLGCILGVYSVYIYYTLRLHADQYDYPGMMFNWKITNGRIRQALDFLMNHPIKLFSSRFPDDGTLFDLGAYRLFYEAGYLWAGVFFLAFFILIILSLKKHWDIVIPICVYFVFCSLYEFDPVTRPTYNIVAFFLPLLVFKSTANQFNTFMLSSQRKGNQAP